MASVWYWGVSLQVGCFSTLRCSKMQVLFLVFWRYRLMLQHFFQILLILLQTFNVFQMKHDFCYLGLMLVCFTMVEGLERFFRTGYHMFSWATIRVTTHVTILLWGVCTVSNALLLLAHYYIDYCMPYYTFQWNKYIFVWFSTPYHTLPWFFLKRSILILF